MSLWACEKCGALHAFTPSMRCSQCEGTLQLATLIPTQKGSSMSPTPDAPTPTRAEMITFLRTCIESSGIASARQMLRAILAEVEASAVIPPQWQSIETAPKDGTDILCTWMHTLDGVEHWSGVMHVLSYFPQWYGDGTEIHGVIRRGGAWVLDGDFNVHFEPDGVHETPPVDYGNPTHWMPLPACPHEEPTR